MSNDAVPKKMEDQAVRIIRQSEETRAYVRDALNTGRDVSEIRLRLGVRAMTGKLDTVVLITALVDEAVATQEAILAYDTCE